MNRASSRAKRSEHELVEWVVAFLLEEGYNVRAEVPNLGKSADLVATRGRWVTFVEVKRHDWRTAFNQCRAHELVADYMCIAIGTKHVSSTARRMAEETGIGLLHIKQSGACEWSVLPIRNASIWPPQRKVLAQEMRAIEYES